MNDEIKTIETIPPFTRFCMTIGQLPTSYLMSMTYYEQLVWLTKYLQDNVIPAVNNNAQALKELQEYVANYFENLDVQEEINKKLDEMAEDGTLSNLISNYITPLINAQNEEITAFKTSVNAEIDSFDSRLSALTSAAPTPVSSTDDMTDTSKVYLLLTDGDWYYYDGETWTSGGTYQATSISDGAIDILKLDSNLQADFLKYLDLIEDPTHYTNFYAYIDGSNKVDYGSNNNFCYDKYSLTSGKIYQVSGGYNYSNTIGIIVTDSSDNVIYSSKTTPAPNTHVPQSLLFRANQENLYLYVTYEQSGTTNYGRLNFHQVYVLDKVYLNDNFNFNPNLLFTYENAYVSYGGGFNANNDSTVRCYNMQKGRKYSITGENVYSIAGLVLTSYDMQTLIYASSDSAVGSTPVRFTYDFTASQDGLILISTFTDSANYSIRIEKNIDENNVLSGKTISCDGDSIMQGNENSNISYYDLIIENYNMVQQSKAAVGGATIATGTQSSGVDRHWISSSVLNINTNSDYILINGGFNDYSIKVDLGEITETFTDTIDSTTFAGGMELLCRNLLNRFNNGQKILFVFNHNINATWYTKNSASSSGKTFEDYFNIQVAVLKKYGIPYIDLIHESQFNTILDFYKNTYTDGDGVHPNTNGYNKFYVDKIVSKMKQL